MTIDQALLDDFLIEAREHITNIENSFLTLEKQDDSNDSTYIDKIFRAIHSIKGSSGFLNLSSITKLTHSMEALLQKVREGQILIESNHIDVLLEGVDILNKLLDNPTEDENPIINDVCNKLSNIKNGSTNNINNEKTLLKQEKKNVQKQVETIKESEFKASDKIISVEELGKIGFVYDSSLLSDSLNLFILEYDLFLLEEERNLTPPTLIYDLIGFGEIIQCNINTIAESFSDLIETNSLFLSVLYQTSLNANELPLVLNLSEKNIKILQNQNIHNNKIKIPNESKKHSKEKTYPQENFEKQNNFKDTNQIKNKKSKPENQRIIKSNTKFNEKNKSNIIPETKIEAHQVETIRINIKILDKVMNLAGELVLVRNQQLLEVDKNNSKQIDISQRLDMVTSELQEAIMRTRMQPLGNLFGRIPRLVRDLEKKMGKSIIVITNGNEVELDKTILESLADPLTHIIRNACDHGIETPKIRLESGKPETGYIKINAYHEAGQINIKIEDDGKGIEPEKIKQKAITKGIKNKNELDRMTDKDLLDLIMLPGFSTVDQTTEISGRGVGMDVVKDSVEQMSGIIDINSTPNKGTIIHLRLPLTLAIIPSLIVNINNERFAIPEINVEELVSLYDREIYTMIETDGDQEVFRLRNNLLPVVRLNEVLARKKQFSESTRFEISEKYSQIAKKMLEQKEDIQEILIFAVLKVGSQRFGLIVDEVLGTEEIVVNPLHSIIKPVKIYSGTTIMGDGTVALILDVNGISNHSGLLFTRDSVNKFHKGLSKNRSDSHRILLFKCGEKELFAIPLILMKRVENIKPQNIQEIGNREYISINGVTTLVIRFENVMNVSKTLHSKKMFLLLPKQSPRPMGFLISNLINVMNMPLELNKEDFMEEGIVGTSLIENTITLFIDLFQIVDKISREWFSKPESEACEKNITKKAKILLVEDTIFFQRLIKEQLESSGYNVSTADNGLLALELLEKDNFDLIVSDIEMPEMDGLTLIKTLRKKEKYQNIPAIAVTSLDSPKDRSIGLNSGFNEYEIKVDKETLLRKIQKLLNESDN